MAALASCAVTAALLKDRTDTQAPLPATPDQAPPENPRDDPADRTGDQTPASRGLPAPAPHGATVALTCEVPGGRPAPRFVLDACLDTAPFGDEAAWTYPRHRERSPTGGSMAADQPIPMREPRSSLTSPPGCGTRRVAWAAAWCVRRALKATRYTVTKAG